MAKFEVAIPKPLERVVVELCEHLPGNTTLFKRGGFCTMPTDYCEYCIRIDSRGNYLCKKQTYTPLGELSTAEPIQNI